MNSSFNELCNMLEDFESECTKTRNIWKQIEIDNPSFEQVSEENWQEKQSRMWLHGATDVWECNELERWLYGDLPTTKVAQSSAPDKYKAWRKWLKISGVSNFTTCLEYQKKTQVYVEVESKEPSGTYYADNDRFDIAKPFKDEILFNFIVRLAHSIEDNGEGGKLERRALKSFLSFLRKKYPNEQVAFIFSQIILGHFSSSKQDDNFILVKIGSIFSENVI